MLDMHAVSQHFPPPIAQGLSGEPSQDSGYSTPSEFVRELLRKDQSCRAEQKLEELLLEGLNSGDPIRLLPSIGKPSGND